MYKKYFLMSLFALSALSIKGLRPTLEQQEEVGFIPVNVTETEPRNENCCNRAVRWFDRHFGVVPAINYTIAIQVILLGVVGNGLYREYMN